MKQAKPKKVEVYINGKKLGYSEITEPIEMDDIYNLKEKPMNFPLSYGSFTLQIENACLDGLTELFYGGLGVIQYMLNEYTGEIETHQVRYHDGVWHIRRIA